MNIILTDRNWKIPQYLKGTRGTSRFYNLEYYSYYFNVDTSEVCYIQGVDLRSLRECVAVKRLAD